MKPHPRIRKTIKWGGAAAIVLLAALWIGSAWRTMVCYFGGRFYVAAANGLVGAGLESPKDLGGAKPGLYSFPSMPGFRWWPHWELTGNSPYAGVPPWILLVPLTAASLTAWRLDTLARRRERHNLCPKCRYDRTGLAAGVVCPECGAAQPHRI